ncbi:aminopeptidase [Cupriavidus sp. USMAA2-4]|nr:aminopeptidase [Cupriavidus sp. USMAA2-4]
MPAYVLAPAGAATDAAAAAAGATPRPGEPSPMPGALPDRARARDLGIRPGVLATGPLNAITDVASVMVGHTTLIEGDSVRTGVTAILPHGGNLFQEKVPAGFALGNGFGKFAGATQIEELGEIETPILLTNTLSVAEGVAGAIEWTLGRPGNEHVLSVNAVVGETNDGFLNDIRGRHVTRQHVLQAIATAGGGPVAEGCVGAGTGTQAFGWKGGIGTSSRRLPRQLGDYTLGVLVQTNYGGVLSIDGVPVGKTLGRYYLKDVVDDHGGDGSVVIVVATDAPLSDRNLGRLAKRAFLGIARTGSSMANGSGDYALAFSTASSVRRTPAQRKTVGRFDSLPNDAMSPLFQAVSEATEEAVYNAMLQAVTTTGIGGHRLEAITPAAVQRALEHARRAGDAR